MTRGEQIRLLQKRVEESGLSQNAFAESVLRREARTVRRWVQGEAPIPQLVLDFLAHPTRAPWPR